MFGEQQTLNKTYQTAYYHFYDIMNQLLKPPKTENFWFSVYWYKAFILILTASQVLEITRYIPSISQESSLSNITHISVQGIYHVVHYIIFLVLTYLIIWKFVPLTAFIHFPSLQNVAFQFRVRLEDLVQLNTLVVNPQLLLINSTIIESSTINN